MPTLSEISGTIQDVRIALQNLLMPEFSNSIKNTTQLINSFLNDPSITANVKESLKQLNKLLTEVGDQGLTQEVTQLITEIHSKLRELDVPVLNDVLTNVDDLPEQAKNVKFIDHMVDALKGAKSINEFAELAKAFSEESRPILLKYGPYGFVLGIALNEILAQLRANRTISEEVKAFRQKNNYSFVIYSLMNTEMLRERMSRDYEEIEMSLHNGEYDFDSEVRKAVIEEREDILLFIDTIPRLSKENIKVLAVLQFGVVPDKCLKAFAALENKINTLVHGFVGAGIKKEGFECLKDLRDDSTQNKPGINMHLLQGFIGVLGAAAVATSFVLLYATALNPIGLTLAASVGASALMCSAYSFFASSTPKQTEDMNPEHLVFTM